eukprot:2320632-Pyramimonas_sp.AAC.1
MPNIKTGGFSRFSASTPVRIMQQNHGGRLSAVSGPMKALAGPRDLQQSVPRRKNGYPGHGSRWGSTF